MNGTGADTELIIKPLKGLSAIGFRVLWQYRELMYFLTWRDIKVKYKQSILGIAWVFFRPVISMLIFSLLFGRMAIIPTEGVPYPLFVFMGLLPWLYFSTSLTTSTASLVGSTSLVSKTYFPRIIIPISSNIANLFDFIISLLILGLLMLYYKVPLSPNILFVPPLIIAFVVISLGPGILFGAMNVKYRDLGHIIPFMVQILMFLTPVIYPVSFLPEKYRMLMYLNPLAGPIEAFRASLMGNMDINFEGLMISLGSGIFIFALSLYYFNRVERNFADVI